MRHLQECSIPCAGKMWRMAGAPARLWEGVLAVFPCMFCIPELFPNPVSPWGSSCSGFSSGTLPKLPVRLQFLSLNTAVCARNDCQPSKKLMVYIHVLHHERGSSRSTEQVPAECKAIQKLMANPCPGTWEFRGHWRSSF